MQENRYAINQTTSYGLARFYNIEQVKKLPYMEIFGE